MQPKSKYTDVKKEETQMIRASMDMGIPNKSMRLTTKSGGCHLPSTRLQDFHKVGSKTRLPPAGTRPQYETSNKFSPSSGKIQTSDTGIWSKILKKNQVMFRIFGDVAHFLNQRDDILFGGRENEEHRHVLKTVIQWARDYGITSNKNIC